MDGAGKCTSNRTYSGISPQADIVQQWMAVYAAPAGTGTSSDPYKITSLNDLFWLSQNSSEWGKYFIQTTNIDATPTSSNTFEWNSGAGWVPIGYALSQTNFVAFTGSYHGKGHTISGLTINSPSGGLTGLFGITYGATLDSLGLIEVSISGGTMMVGSLVGFADTLTIVSNCYATGNVTGSGKNVGGLIGQSFCHIDNCHATCTVTGGQNIGGLIGKNDGTVSNSFATGIVVVTSNNPAGGLIGDNELYYSLDKTVYSISNCYATGAVSGSGSDGGLIGSNESNFTVNNCYATGIVSGNGGSFVGGLIGNNTSSIASSCFATGTISDGDGTGGLIGSNNTSSKVNSCFALGTVNGGGCVGGLVGMNYTSSTISNCYARGNVTETTNNVGGLVGRNASSSVFLFYRHCL